jgi:tRNA threonylcarbamoyladenosine biosynthesis protein TsaE
MSSLFASPSTEEEMIVAGARLGGELTAGSWIALNGPLGAGKTHFVKGIAVGLGYYDDVTSPTFGLVREYHGGRLPLFHFDFYRIESIGELIQLGWDEYTDEAGAIVVEWAERFPELFPEKTRWFDLLPQEDGIRDILER